MTPYLKDALERIAATFAEAFLGYLIAALTGGASITRVVLITAALTAAKVAVAKFAGDRDNASLLPDPNDTPITVYPRD